MSGREEVKFTIYGEPASKANSRRAVMFGKRPAFIKSDKARAYENDALPQIPERYKLNFDMPLRITLHMYYASHRPDLDESIVLDVMQARFKKIGGKRVCIRNGVYVNDRLVREKHVYHHIDKARPRVEIEIAAVEDEVKE